MAEAEIAAEHFPLFALVIMLMIYISKSLLTAAFFSLPCRVFLITWPRLKLDKHSSTRY